MKSGNIFLKVIGWILAIIVLLGIAAGGVLLMRRAKAISNKSKEGNRSESAVASSEVMNGEGVALVSGISYAMPRALVYSSTTAEANAAGDGITIHATVQPSGVANKNTVFTLAFAHADSEWAAEKNVGDYITVTPTETPGEAILCCLAPFGEQIELTATSVLNPELTATCTIDYLQKAEWITFGESKIRFNQNNVFSMTEGSNEGGAVSYNPGFSDIYSLAGNTDIANVELSLFADINDVKYAVYQYQMGAPYGFQAISYASEYMQGDGTYRVELHEGDSVLLDRSFFQTYGIGYGGWHWEGSQMVDEFTNLSDMSDEGLAAMLETRPRESIVLWTLIAEITYRDGTHEVLEADIMWDRLIKNYE